MSPIELSWTAKKKTKRHDGVLNIKRKNAKKKGTMAAGIKSENKRIKK